MILDRELIQKYKLAKQGNQIDGVMLLPSCNGEYIKHQDYIREVTHLKETIRRLQQTKEDLIQSMVELNKTISDKDNEIQSYLSTIRQIDSFYKEKLIKKEFEITAISDRLNNMYLTTKDTIS